MMFWQFLQALLRLAPFFALKLTYGSFPRPLTAEEERDAFARMQAGDAAAREMLISHNLRLVAHMTKKFYAGRSEPDDLVSIGTIGLIKAVDSFKPDRGTRFSTYAARCIENEILMQFRSEQKLRGDISMNEPLDCDTEGTPLTVTDVLCAPQDIAEFAERSADRARLRKALQQLPPRERFVLQLRYGLDGKRPLTQQEVAARLGISRSYISRIEKRAVRALRTLLAD